MTAADNESLRRDIRKAFIRRILTYIAVIIILVIVVSVVFRQFHIYSNARLALREAKNVKMSLEMINLEYYAAGISIYDDTAEGNLKKGAKAYVEKIQGNIDGLIRLTGYDSAKRLITGLEYETNEYIVRFTRHNEEETWTVSLIKELLKY